MNNILKKFKTNDENKLINLASLYILSSQLVKTKLENMIEYRIDRLYIMSSVESCKDDKLSRGLKKVKFKNAKTLKWFV